MNIIFQNMHVNPSIVEKHFAYERSFSKPYSHNLSNIYDFSSLKIINFINISLLFYSIDGSYL